MKILTLIMPKMKKFSHEIIYQRAALIGHKKELFCQYKIKELTKIGQLLQLLHYLLGIFYMDQINLSSFLLVS